MKDTDEYKSEKDTDEYKSELPLTTAGIAKFLAGSRVPGIGPAYAKALVDRFGSETLHILRYKPELAAEVPGISENLAARVSDTLTTMKVSAEVIAFLYSCGVSESFIDRIISKYRQRTEEVLLRDPYSMVESVWRLSFFMADKIGRALNVSPDNPGRLVGALVGAVKHYAENGHLFATVDEALQYASGITGITPEIISKYLNDAVTSGRLVKSRDALYLPVFYKAEKEGAERLMKLAATPVPQFCLEDVPECNGEGQKYSEVQRRAILTLVNSPVAVLTGGPGTGKTTVLRGVLDMFEKLNIQPVLAAPTGRAAKRMTTLTGLEATTIHRLLGYRQGEGYFTRHIDAGALIIDEGSMMEQVLFDHLLEALAPGTRVLMVGDVDQLPAIGAGNVLRDLIDSGVVAVAVLDENFRQQSGSLIAAGAAAINAGLTPESSEESDFMIFEEKSIRAIHDRILHLLAYELPESRGIAPTDIRVVTPQQIGPLGARQLNTDLQQHLNPDSPALRRGQTIMRLGDPVMQTANNSRRKLYNGEVGIITEVNEDEQTLRVSFPDSRESVYARSELSELTLAYAMTVHKLQGSEVEYMIFPITMAHKPMLYRNMIYTGVSRATRLCVLVGEKEALEFAIGNNPDSSRNSNFIHRLRESLNHN